MSAPEALASPASFDDAVTCWAAIRTLVATGERGIDALGHASLKCMEILKGLANQLANIIVNARLIFCYQYFSNAFTCRVRAFITWPLLKCRLSIRPQLQWRREATPI
jgi:hypothetical protein